MIEFFNVFGKFGVILVVAICASIPAIETKIAVPLGVSHVWGESCLSLFGATLVAFVSSTLVAIFLMLVLKFFLKKIKKHQKPKFLVSSLSKIQKFFKKPIDLISQKKPQKMFWLLVMFVSLPLPVLGLFSGAVLCAMLNVKNKIAIPAIVVGNFLDSLFVFLLCLALKPFLSLLLTVFVIITILMALFWILKFVLQKNDEKNLKKHEKTVKNS